MAWTSSNYTWASGYYVMPVVYGSGVPASVPKAETPLEWLDGEVERTCALARVS